MTIEWKGEGCFDIRGVADKVSIITEYPDRESGLSAPRSKSDIYISTTGDLADTLFSDKSEDKFVISGPGEYEIKDVFISGLKASFDKNDMMKVVYLISMEGLKIGYLDGLDKEDINPEIIGFLEEVDVLIAPVGGNGVLDAEEAVKVINQIEPKIVIPSHYKTKGLKTKRGDLETFLKEAGEKVESEKKILIKKKDLSFEGMRIVPLSND